MISYSLVSAAVSTVAEGAKLFSVTTVAVLIVLSLGTKVAPKWAEKQVFFYCGSTAQNASRVIYFPIAFSRIFAMPHQHNPQNNEVFEQQ
jgi:hypothetical protein